MDAATVQKLEEIRTRLESDRLEEASEIEATELKPALKKARAQLGRILGAKPSTIWEGIHGIIFEYDPPSVARLSAASLAKLVKVKGLRWFDTSDGDYAVGMGYNE